MRWAFYAFAALVIAGIVAVALFPLSLALRLADAPVEGTPSGTVWNGVIEDASANSVALGTVEVGARPWPTLIGRPAARLGIAGPQGTGTTRATVANGVTLTDIDAVVPAAPYSFAGPFGSALTGDVTVRGDATLAMDGACRAAALTIETDVLVRAAAQLGQTGPILTGPATCEDGTLVARLTGASPDADAGLLVRLRPGTYVTELTLAPTDPRAGALLRRYGFREGPGGYTLTTRGTY